jgi:hypothetical protein
MLLNQHDRAGKLSGCNFIFEKFGQALKRGCRRHNAVGFGLNAGKHPAASHHPGCDRQKP